MVARPNHPIDNVRKLQRRLYIAAKCNQERRFHALYDRIWRSDVLLEAWKRVILEARMPHEKTIGKPDAGNPTSGLNGGLRKRSPCTAPEVYQ